MLYVFSMNAGFWRRFAGLNGFIAVAMGAVSAHAIQEPQAAAMAEKAALYQLIHAAVLFGLADRSGFKPSRWLFLAGIFLFCGTLYVHACFGWEAVTRLAPFGGTGFMLGWLALAFY